MPTTSWLKESILKWILYYKWYYKLSLFFNVFSDQHRTQISHFYSHGSICDKTGNPRQTEVKLKCLENSSSPAQVSLYLLEPKTCEYILGVESPIICDILHLADEDGLVNIPSLILEGRGHIDESMADDEEGTSSAESHGSYDSTENELDAPPINV